MRSKKNAQATLFMIVGLIVIMGGAVFFYSTQSASKQLAPEVKIAQEQAPLEFDPIKSYANDCASSVAVEGLKIIGKQGGYISLTNRALSHESFTITQSPTESDAVSFTKDSDLKIPYWWHLKSANTCRGSCQFASKRPDLRKTDNSIEKQLERYVNAKFEDCLNNFEPFVKQGFRITKNGAAKTHVTIGAEDVSVLIEYPITAEKQGTKSDLRSFDARIPINLERIYELATKITNLEMQHHYLERHVLDLISAFSGVDKNKLPPTSEIQFKFGNSISWQKSEIKNKITGLLSSYIPLFQVDGTYNFERNIFDSELKQRLYDSTIIPVANSSFEDLTAYFTYLDFWPIYFNLNCNGERCAPSSANSFLPFLSLGIQTYEFVYDMSFPVLIELQDPSALNSQGYNFNFFLEGNIRSNSYMQGNFAPLEFSSISERSQLCDLRTSGNITVMASDSITKKPLEDAQILYSLTDESCFIGSTNSDGKIMESFPVGVGGVVSATKDHYIGRSIDFDASLDSEQSLNAELAPITTKKIIVKKKNVVKTLQGWQFKDEAVDLNDKESAVVTLTRISDESELGFSSVASYKGQQQEKSEIDVAPGDYTADATLTLNQKIVVPEKQKCVKKLGGLLGEECYTIPKVDFGEGSSAGQETFPEGGLKLKFTITPQDLQHDTIVIYAVGLDIASVPEEQRVVEDLDQIGQIESYSESNKMALQPAFE